MHSAERSIEIDVPAEAFYELITDFESYPDFLSDVHEAEILNREDEIYDVRFTVRVIRRFDYVLRLVGAPYEKLEWTLLKPGFFTFNEGSWRIESLTETRIRAQYQLDVRVGAFVPKAITDRLAAAVLPDMLGEWKTRAEALYAEKTGSGGKS